MKRIEDITSIIKIYTRTRSKKQNKGENEKVGIMEKRKHKMNWETKAV